MHLDSSWRLSLHCITTTHNSLPFLPAPTPRPAEPWPWCGLTLQKLRNIFQLGNVVFTEPAVLFQKWENVVVFIAGMRFIQGLQCLEHCSPGLLLFFCVFHPRDGLPTRIQSWNRCLQQRRVRTHNVVKSEEGVGLPNLWGDQHGCEALFERNTNVLVPTGKHGLVEELLSF